MRLSDARPGQRGTVEWDGNRLVGIVTGRVDAGMWAWFAVAAMGESVPVPTEALFTPESPRIPTEDGAVIRIGNQLVVHTSEHEWTVFGGAVVETRWDRETVQAAADAVGGFVRLIPEEQ